MRNRCIATPVRACATDVNSLNDCPPPRGAGRTPPVPPAGVAWALFLDFDGTLVEFAATPDAVVVPRKVRAILSACADALDGAVAIVSGRPIATLDALLAPLRLPSAGLHGLEVRMPDGNVEHADSGASDLAELRTRLLSLAREDARLVVEDKKSSLALHYRRAPERESELRALVADAADQYRGHHVLHGKMIVEVKPARINKGDAVGRFLESSPFAGRRPIFAGDDLTDEDGFAAVNRLGGVSVKVGAGESSAACRVPDVDALHDWLAAVAGIRAVD